MLDLFKDFERLRKKVIELLEHSQKLEEEKEVIYKMLLEAERECGELREERDRLKAACKMKDILIRKSEQFTLRQK